MPSSGPLGMTIRIIKKPRHLSGFGIYPKTENLLGLLLRQPDVHPLNITADPRKWKWIVFSMSLCHPITPTTLCSKHDITWNFPPWQLLRPEHPCFWLGRILLIVQLSPAVKDPWNPRKGTRKTHILEAFSPCNLHNRENPETGNSALQSTPVSSGICYLLVLRHSAFHLGWGFKMWKMYQYFLPPPRGTYTSPSQLRQTPWSVPDSPAEP